MNPAIALPIGRLITFMSTKTEAFVLARTEEEAETIARHGTSYATKAEAKAAMERAPQAGRWANLRVFRVTTQVREEK